MSYFNAILLGIAQGLTEFLPVSSSGHLVLLQGLLGVKRAGVAFELLVHLGTLAAVLIYFRSTIRRLALAVLGKGARDDRRMVVWLIVGTVPAGVVGLLLQDFFKQAFSSPLVTSCMLFVTGAILLATKFVRRGDHPISFASALVMGIGQAVAIMPGISRSGTTIASGLFAGVKPSQAAEFSFLLSIPAVAGAILLEAHEILSVSSDLMAPYLLGTLISFIFGLLSVYLVLTTIKRGKFDYFAYYCFAAGTLGLYLFV